MKKIRLIIKNPLFSMFTAFAVLFVSCNNDEATQNFMGKKNAKSYNVKDYKYYSDEMVFRGVMFLDGPVSKKLPDFKEFNFRNYVKDVSKISSVLNFQKKIIDQIKTEKPDYLKTFRSKISSGDFYRVKSAIVDAANIIAKKTMALSSKSNVESVKRISSVIENKFSQHNTKEAAAVSSTVWYDTDTVVYSEVAVVAIIAVLAVIDIFLSAVNSQNNLRLNEYTKGKYLSDVTLNFQGI